MRHVHSEKRGEERFVQHVLPGGLSMNSSRRYQAPVVELVSAFENTYRKVNGFTVFLLSFLRPRLAVPEPVQRIAFRISVFVFVVFPSWMFLPLVYSLSTAITRLLDKLG